MWHRGGTITTPLVYRQLKTYAPLALLGGLVDQHGERHPVAVLQLLRNHALRQLGEPDQPALRHLAVHLTGRDQWVPGTERDNQLERLE